MQGYIDIFDGGPTVEAPAAEIRTIKHSRLLRVETGTPSGQTTPHLVANTRLDEFRCLLADLGPAGVPVLSKVQLEALRVKPGDTVRVTAI